jgi:hypothetical protein
MVLFSIILFIFFPLASLPVCLVLSLLMRFRSCIMLILISISLGLISYTYVPQEASDIYRHYLMIDEMAMFGFPALYDKLQGLGGPALFYITTYICSIFSVYNLLPLLTVTLTYALYLLGLRKFFIEARVQKISIIVISTMWVFSTLSFPFIMTNLRQPLAVGCIFAVLSRPSIRNIYAYTLVISAMLFHITGYFMAACLIISLLFNYRKHKLYIIFVMLITATILLLISMGYNFGIQHKIDTYLNADLTQRYRLENFWQFVVLSFLNAFTFLLLATQIFKLQSFSSRRKTLSIYFVVIYFIGASVFISNFIVYQRLMLYLPLFSIAMLIGYMDLKKKDILYYLTIMLVIISTSYAMILQWANFQEKEFWSGIVHRDFFSILILAKNHFL